MIPFALDLAGGFGLSVSISITRLDLDASGLRQAASRSHDGPATRRMLALALILEGVSRTDAAKVCGMDRQTLRDWVHRYNAEGLGGLIDRQAPGAVPFLTAEQQQTVAQWVKDGPDISVDGIVRWRRSDLSRRIEREFGVVMAERSVGEMLRRLGFRRLSVRPQHPGQDASAQEAHKKTSPTWSLPASLSPCVTSPSKSGGRMKHASVNKER